MPLLGTRGAGSGRGFGFQGGKRKVGFDYLIIAGGGSGDTGSRGAGGAGGYRTSFPGGTTIELEPGSYPITVGAGGAGRVSPGSGQGTSGQSSVFDTITSNGGGGGGANDGQTPTQSYGIPGGSGGGGGDYYPTQGSYTNPGGTGNSPPTSPPQGNNGGAGQTYNTPQHGNWGGGGGGGANAVGNDAVPGPPISPVAGPGGAGATSTITGSPVQYAGGGGGGLYHTATPRIGLGGAGGGGNGAANGLSPGQAGTDGLGGGGGGGAGGNTYGGSDGGDGVVILRAPSDAKFSVSPGTNTIQTTPTGEKYATFTVSGDVSIP